MEDEATKLKIKVKRELADFLGVDLEDIDDDTSFRRDLHMSPANLTDFSELLKKAGFETDKIDFSEIEVFSDLFDQLTEGI